MERLKCKACGSVSMVPMEVAVEEEEELVGSEHESRFFTCHVCGDNWLSVKQTDLDGQCQITFVHQMGMEPVLKRTAQMHTPVVVAETTVNQWDYFLGEDVVEEETWHEELGTRRQMLKSICSN